MRSTLMVDERVAGTAARLMWCLTAFAVGLSLVPVVRNSFIAVYRFCGNDSCISGQLTAPAAHGLESIGLAPTVYAAYDDVLLVGMVATFCAVAAAIVWRRSTDPMALLTAFTLTLFGGATLVNGARLLGSASVWFEPTNILAMLGSLGIGLFAYLFPSGPRLGSSIAGRLLVPILIAAWTAVQVSTYVIGSGYLDFNSPNNPAGPPEWLFFLLSMIAVQIYRYRKQADPVQRQQTKWVVLGITTALLGFISLLAIAAFVPNAAANTALFLSVQTVFRLVLLPVPISIAFAVLRHRLWDVDILINRTIVYAGLTISIALFYVGGVIVFQFLFRAISGQSSELAVALSTLLVAALFNPWRRQLQVFIDRRFYRRKYDAGRVLAQFQSRLVDEVDLDKLASGVIAVVAETFEPEVAALWLAGRRGDA